MEPFPWMPKPAVQLPNQKETKTKPTYPYVLNGRFLLFPRLFQTQTTSSSSRDGEEALNLPQPEATRFHATES